MVAVGERPKSGQSVRPSGTCDSSMHSEAYASSRATEVILYEREVLRFLGVQPVGPTTLYSDNKAKILVAMKRSKPGTPLFMLERNANP